MSRKLFASTVFAISSYGTTFASDMLLSISSTATNSDSLLSIAYAAALLDTTCLELYLRTLKTLLASSDSVEPLKLHLLQIDADVGVLEKWTLLSMSERNALAEILAVVLSFTSSTPTSSVLLSVLAKLLDSSVRSESSELILNENGAPLPMRNMPPFGLLSKAFHLAVLDTSAKAFYVDAKDDKVLDNVLSLLTYSNSEGRASVVVSVLTLVEKLADDSTTILKLLPAAADIVRCLGSADEEVRAKAQLVMRLLFGSLASARSDNDHVPKLRTARQLAQKLKLSKSTNNKKNTAENAIFDVTPTISSKVFNNGECQALVPKKVFVDTRVATSIAKLSSDWSPLSGFCNVKLFQTKECDSLSASFWVLVEGSSSNFVASLRRAAQKCATILYIGDTTMNITLHVTEAMKVQITCQGIHPNQSLQMESSETFAFNKWNFLAFALSERANHATVAKSDTKADAKADDQDDFITVVSLRVNDNTECKEFSSKKIVGGTWTNRPESKGDVVRWHAGIINTTVSANSVRPDRIAIEDLKLWTIASVDVPASWNAAYTQQAPNDLQFSQRTSSQDSAIRESFSHCFSDLLSAMKSFSGHEPLLNAFKECLTEEGQGAKAVDAEIKTLRRQRFLKIKELANYVHGFEFILRHLKPAEWLRDNGAELISCAMSILAPLVEVSTLNSGKLSPISIESDHPYRNNLDEKKRLRYDLKQIADKKYNGLKIWFDERSSSEMNYDFVSFHSHESCSEESLLGDRKYTGGLNGSEKNYPTKENPLVVPIKGTSDNVLEVWAWMQSDGSTNDFGWIIYAIPTVIETESHKDTDEDTLIVESLHPYTVCDYVQSVTVPGADFIEITFHLHTDICSTDRLGLYSDVECSQPLVPVEYFYGNIAESRGNLPIQSLVIEGDTFFVRFISSSESSGWGFHLTVRPSPLNLRGHLHGVMQSIGSLVKAFAIGNTEVYLSYLLKDNLHGLLVALSLMNLGDDLGVGSLMGDSLFYISSQFSVLGKVIKDVLRAGVNVTQTLHWLTNSLSLLTTNMDTVKDVWFSDVISHRHKPTMEYSRSYSFPLAAAIIVEIVSPTLPMDKLTVTIENQHQVKLPLPASNCLTVYGDSLTVWYQIHEESSIDWQFHVHFTVDYGENESLFSQQDPVSTLQQMVDIPQLLEMANRQDDVRVRCASVKTFSNILAGFTPKSLLTNKMDNIFADESVLVLPRGISLVASLPDNTNGQTLCLLNAALPKDPKRSYYFEIMVKDCTGSFVIGFVPKGSVVQSGSVSQANAAIMPFSIRIGRSDSKNDPNSERMDESIAVLTADHRVDQNSFLVGVTFISPTKDNEDCEFVVCTGEDQCTRIVVGRNLVGVEDMIPCVTMFGSVETTFGLTDSAWTQNQRGSSLAPLSFESSLNPSWMILDSSAWRPLNELLDGVSLTTRETRTSESMLALNVGREHARRACCLLKSVESFETADASLKLLYRTLVTKALKELDAADITTQRYSVFGILHVQSLTASFDEVLRPLSKVLLTAISRLISANQLSLSSLSKGLWMREESRVTTLNIIEDDLILVSNADDCRLVESAHPLLESSRTRLLEHVSLSGEHGMECVFDSRTAVGDRCTISIYKVDPSKLNPQELLKQTIYGPFSGAIKQRPEAPVDSMTIYIPDATEAWVAIDFEEGSNGSDWYFF